jgi:hypothetical protein
MEQIKVSEEEINKLKELQSNYETLTIQFGQICIEKINLEQLEYRLKEELMNSRKLEQELYDALQAKYGIGELNLETGLFTKSTTV